MEMKERGQGLVEMALILPFLLVLVVGMVELGVALNRQIVVVNAAREGARFGATGASPGDIHEVTLSATSQMFDFAEGDSVVFVVHAEVDKEGNGFEEWIVNAWPEGSDAPHVTPGEVLADLQAHGDASGVKLVIVDVEYDHRSLLGLPIVGAVADRIPVGSWAAMRLESLGTAGGREPACCILPIALDVNALAEDMVDIRFGGGPGTFGWLYWDPLENGNAGYLESNLENPCRVAEEFKNACDYTDITLDVGDWVAGDTGESVSIGVRHAITEGQYIRIPLWDRFEACNEIGCACQPGSQAAHVVGFAIVEVTDVDLIGSPKTISAKFVRMDEGCQ
jgi:hypothetical protein